MRLTLFRAVEAGRTRSIDQVIRKISGMLPDDVKKKAELKPPSNFEVEPVKDSSEKKEKKAKLEDSKKSFPVEILSRDIPEVAITAKGKEGEGNTQLSVEEESSVPTVSKKDERVESSRQIVDREKIEAKIAELPDGIRAILEEKFQADFVSIEKIDMNKLI